MYTADDFVRAQKGFHTRLYIAIALLAATIACLCVALTLRLRLFGMISMLIGLWITYYFAATKMNPWRKYYLLLKDMKEGLERETQMRFWEISGEPRMLDGVAVYDFMVYEGDDEAEQRLFLWDADKPLPTYPKGQLLDIVSFGKYIKSVKAI